MNSPPGPPPVRYVADCTGARLHVYARSLATVLRIDGDIDASNAECVAQEIRRFSRLQSPLIVDFSQLNFLGIDGFRALLGLNREHQDAGLHFSVVTGPAMHLLTRIVKDHGLPIVGSIAEALQDIQDAIATRRQFLSGLARQQQTQSNSLQG
jgi:anti-sigma B factor antagonist